MYIYNLLEIFKICNVWHWILCISGEFEHRSKSEQCYDYKNRLDHARYHFLFCLNTGKSKSEQHIWKLYSHYRRIIVSSLVEIRRVVLTQFWLIHHYIPLCKYVALNSLYPKMLWAIFVWISQVVLEKLLFAINSSWKWAWFWIWKNPTCIYLCFVQSLIEINLTSGSQEYVNIKS